MNHAAYFMQFQLPQAAQKELKALGVFTVYLFGSRAAGTEHALSDYDFAILMHNAQLPNKKQSSHLYNQIYDILSPLCPRQFPNDIIDIVFLTQVPLELQFQVINTGRVVMDAHPVHRANTEAAIQLRFCDFAPYRTVMREALLARL